jgi:hypothetical protein
VYDLQVADGTETEICDNGVDEDLDGFTDCEDYECVTDAACACGPEDALEDNDDEASAVPGVDATALLVHTDDEDWFAYTIPSGQRLLVTAPNAAATVELSWVESGNTLNGSLDQGADEVLVVANPSTVDQVGAVRVRTNFGETCVTYDLDFELAAIPPETCDNGQDDDGDGFADCFDFECGAEPSCAGTCPPEDIYELNDSLATAALNIPSTTGLGLHAQSDDWFTFDVAPGSQLFLEVDHVESLGDIDIYLFDDAEVLVSSGTFSIDRETVLAVNNTANTRRYALQLIQNTATCTSYDLTVTNP